MRVFNFLELTPEELRGGQGGNGGDPFDRLDTNRDGRLSLSEWPGNRNSFERLDRNRDGFLSRQEFAGVGDDDEDDG